jgi:hypothetical protein
MRGFKYPKDDEDTSRCGEPPANGCFKSLMEEHHQNEGRLRKRRTEDLHSMVQAFALANGWNARGRRPSDRPIRVPQSRCTS